MEQNQNPGSFFKIWRLKLALGFLRKQFASVFEDQIHKPTGVLLKRFKLLASAWIFDVYIVWFGVFHHDEHDH